MSLRLVQFTDESGRRRVDVPSEDGRTLKIVSEAERVYDLALAAIASNRSLEALVQTRMSHETADCEAAVKAQHVLPPLDHPDPCRCHVAGTGLTHLGSADTRDKMHKTTTDTEEAKRTNSMNVFRWGLELRLGPVPADIRGTRRIRRDGKVIFENPFLTGEANMSHSLANLEHHHSKCAEHRVPGDVFEIEAPRFGRPLRNALERGAVGDGAAALRTI